LKNNPKTTPTLLSPKKDNISNIVPTFRDFLFYSTIKTEKLYIMESTYKGKLDLQGILNLDSNIRTGY